MLFNSPEFLFGFLPLTLLGFFLLSRADRSLRTPLAWLCAASIFFYGWWNPNWVPLLLLSIAWNLWIAKRIWRARLDEDAGAAPDGAARRILTAGLGVNLAVLFFYKYSEFFAENLAVLVGTPLHAYRGTLPLGISFFTFTQIAYLVDVYQRKAADFQPVRYGLFVSYFPHLIAGPILHHGQMMPQFADRDIFRFSASRLALGSTTFILGLFKKVVIADQLGRYAGFGFAAVASHDLTLFEAWAAVLSYTLQIYFDFSGYSDMAIGLAAMIGVRLPLNFHSPYKSLSITEFWRRWHMTLSRFLRDYLYIPLGGNRRGRARRYLNLLITMLLGGMWHGAGWTFLIWGALHGLYLVINHAWDFVVGGYRLRAAAWWRLPLTVASWGLTFLAVVFAWVFFRSPNLRIARRMLVGMSGANGAVLPAQLLAMFPWLGHIAQGAGKVPYLGDGSVLGSVELVTMLVFALGLAVFAPAMSDLSPRARLVLTVPCAALALQQVLFGAPSEFLYFQF